MADRVHKSLMNAKVGFTFYFLSIFIAFFSRRIFLECLGDQFIGLTGTLGSILNLLNITEVGIGTCIGYFLYKPIEQGDKEKICEIVSLFGWMYRIIGSIIVCGGIIISLFFPIIFAKEITEGNINLNIVYFAFFSFLASNIIGYFINYRQIILDSDQKTYKISIWTQTCGTIKTIVQIILAYYYKNLYLWVTVEFVFSLIICWILNHVINKEYPWLKTDKNQGRFIIKKYPEILIKVKQIVVHRLKNVLLSRCDEVFIYTFESLQMVTFYGNYTMIVGKLTALFNNVLVGMNASIGNLIAEGNQQNIKKVFWEFVTFRYWTTGIFIIGLAFLINPVINWWLGPQYVLADHIVFLILLNMYIMLTRPSVDLFINAYGLYSDVWAAYAEGFINLIVTLVFGYLYGIVGILLGKIVSMFFLVVLWKPYYLFRDGFKRGVYIYWKNILIHVTILTLCLIMMQIATLYLNWVITPTLWGIFSFALCFTIPAIIIYSLCIYIFCPGAKDLIYRLPLHRQ